MLFAPISSSINIFYRMCIPLSALLFYGGEENELQIMEWNKQKDSMKANVDKYCVIVQNLIIIRK